MRLQFRAIIMGLLFFAASAGSANAQTATTASRWITSNLPQGVKIQSSTPAQLAAAVKAAIRAHPKQAKAIVASVFSQLGAGDQDKALALINAIISVAPADEVADLIKIAIGSLSAAIDPQTGQSAQSALTTAITQQAIADDPALASVSLAAIGAAAPGPGIQSQFQGPGNVTNPANFSNTTGAVNSPP
jgi:hypothetical protein